MKTITEALAALAIQLIQSVQTIIDLAGVIGLTAICSLGEIANDVTVYQDIDWKHVLATIGPFIAKDVGQYIYHKKEVAKALATPVLTP